MSCVAFGQGMPVMSPTDEVVEKLRKLNLKKLSPDARRAWVTEIRRLLDAGPPSPRSPDALKDRVRLLRIWHMLLALGASDPPPLYEPDPPDTFDESRVLPLDLIAGLTDPSFPSGADLLRRGSRPEDGLNATAGRSSALRRVPPPPDDGLERRRLILVRDGVLMGRTLTAGTVIYVFPVDATHLIESGMAEEFSEGDEDEFSPEA